jgi:hypothetical protein
LVARLLQKAMVDIFLIIVCIVFTGLSFAVGLYIVVSFQHKEDRVGPFYSWMCKIIVTVSLGCAAMNVLILPLDALNRATHNSLQIDLMCWIFTIASLGLAFVVVPFAIGYYERHDDEDEKCPTIKSLLCVIPFLLFALIFFLILWFAVGRCEIPVLVQQTPLMSSSEANKPGCDNCRMICAGRGSGPRMKDFANPRGGLQDLEGDAVRRRLRRLTDRIPRLHSAAR